MELQTQTHLLALRGLLMFRLGELRADVHAAQMARSAGDTAAGSSATDVRDRKDEAESLRLQRTDDAQEARDLAELHQVEAALQRLDAGTYGDCADCGEPIALQRLMSMPSAERCAPCQAKLEHRR